MNVKSITNNGVNGILKNSKIIAEIALIFAACVIAWAVIKERVNYNKDNITINQTAIKNTQDEIKMMREKTWQDIASIQSDIKVMAIEQKVIKEGINEIKSKLDR